jgi:hypothetical protein
MWPLRAAGRRELLDSGELAAGLGQGRAWGGARGHWGTIWGLGRGRERAGEGGAGGQAWWPPRLESRQRGLKAGGVGRLGSLGRGREGWWQGSLGVQPTGACSSPWLLACHRRTTRPAVGVLRAAGGGSSGSI